MVNRADAHDAIYFDNVVAAVFGLFFWEWFITLDFDFGFICGRRKFKWPMIFYFYARYAFLAALVGTIFVANDSRQVNCQALSMTILLLKHSTLWASSVSLSIRTMTLWEYSRPIMIIILPLIAFQMAAVCVSSTWDLKVMWSEVASAQGRCIPLNISFFRIAVLYMYTVVLDFIVLCLTLIPIFMLLFRDGLVYFILVFIVTLISVIWLIVDHITAMAIGMHIVPGTATIAAGRAVRHLYNYAGPVPETTRADDGMSLTIPDTPNIRTESDIL
ncbi:hypothetical protein C8J56DRAFT_1078182 [Mycena floridula]|nr:hypothetical protein C8J56DRAFT_1078182 [Mycena floridula]